MIFHLTYQVIQLKHGYVMRKKMYFHRNTHNVIAGKLTYFFRGTTREWQEDHTPYKSSKMVKISVNILVSEMEEHLVLKM